MAKIELSVHDYCHGCPEFEAEVDKAYCSNDLIGTIIGCANHRQCEIIYDHLKKTQEAKNGDYIPPKRT